MLHKIAVATPAYPASIGAALEQVSILSGEAAAAGAEIICFPETYLPGYPEPGFQREECSREQLQVALSAVRDIARQSAIAIIIPMDWLEGPDFLNVAWVISGTGESQGYQAKNQLDPSEDLRWKPGKGRRVFELNGLVFGISICHEGFRYPETVRWAARNGAHIVFHPNFSGTNTSGKRQVEWGSKDSPYYEKAQMVRALENTIYFASSNYCLDYPESASAIIDPEGNCMAFQPYGTSGIVAADIDTEKATGKLAKRLRSEAYEP